MTYIIAGRAAIILLAPLVRATMAFVVSPLPLVPTREAKMSSSTSAHRFPSMRIVVSMISSDANVDSTAKQRATRLRETAAEFRAQAAALEDQKARERRTNADRSFKSFAKGGGVVGIAELQAGLEGPLRKTFVRQLAARMGRKPTPEEVDEKITELPGGCLFPDDLARRLIDMYDQNGDGLLQQSEFAPEEELRARLESMFRERRDEELEARRKERERELEGKKKAEMMRLGDSNDATATPTDRVLCALPYFLPLSDGIMYARHLYETFPQQLEWTEPLAVVLIFCRTLPFATLAAFFGMSLLARSPQVNKLLRFNLIQAINFDIALIAPSLLGPLATWSLGDDAYKLVPITDALSDVLFLSLVFAIIYSVTASSLGTFPNKLPLFGRLNRENPDRNN